MDMKARGLQTFKVGSLLTSSVSILEVMVYE